MTQPTNSPQISPELFDEVFACGASSVRSRPSWIELCPMLASWFLVIGLSGFIVAQWTIDQRKRKQQWDEIFAPLLLGQSMLGQPAEVIFNTPEQISVLRDSIPELSSDDRGRLEALAIARAWVVVRNKEKAIQVYQSIADAATEPLISQMADAEAEALEGSVDAAAKRLGTVIATAAKGAFQDHPQVAPSSAPAVRDARQSMKTRLISNFQQPQPVEVTVDPPFMIATPKENRFFAIRNAGIAAMHRFHAWGADPSLPCGTEFLTSVRCAGAAPAAAPVAPAEAAAAQDLLPADRVLESRSVKNKDGQDVIVYLVERWTIDPRGHAERIRMEVREEELRKSPVPVPPMNAQ